MNNRRPLENITTPKTKNTTLLRRKSNQSPKKELKKEDTVNLARPQTLAKCMSSKPYANFKTLQTTDLISKRSLSIS